MLNFRRQTKKSLAEPIEEDVNDIIARIKVYDEKQDEVIEDNTVVYHRLSDVRLSAFANFRQHPQIVRFRKFLGNYTLFRHFFCKNRKFCYFSACFLC